MKTASFLLAGLLASLSFGAAQAAAPAAGAPMRHLVYSFHFGMKSSAEAHNSGFSGSGGGSGSGVSTYSRSDGDEGTISIDVLREQADHGLVLSVSEQSRNGHDAKPTTCVVYGTGTTICDPNGKVNIEEYSIVRFLGQNFVDPALIDAKQHWHTQSSGGSYSAENDYTITKNNAGVMSISEERLIAYGGATAGKATVTTTIAYDFNRTIPTSITELTTSRQQEGEMYKNVNTQVDASLTTDSMAH